MELYIGCGRIDTRPSKVGKLGRANRVIDTAEKKEAGFNNVWRLAKTASNNEKRNASYKTKREAKKLNR